MNDFSAYAVYLIKLGVYIPYCYLGLRLVGAPEIGRWRSASLIGLLRFGLGLAFGALTHYVLAQFGVSGGRAIPLATVVAMVVTRLLIWSGIAALIIRRGDRSRSLVWWVLGGVALSFVTDALVFLAFSTAVGGIC